MSLGASGTIGGALTFGTWKGRSVVREHVRPANPKSGGQVGRRAMFAFITTSWDALWANEKAEWNALAKAGQSSGFNLYLSFNQTRWHNFRTPSVLPAATEIGAASNRVLTAAAWEENRIKLSSTANTGNERWGFIIFAKLAGAVTPAVANAIRVQDDVPLGALENYWTPPTPGRWYFNSIAFADDGAQAAPGGPVDTGA